MALHVASNHPAAASAAATSVPRKSAVASPASSCSLRRPTAASAFPKKGISLPARQQKVCSSLRSLAPSVPGLGLGFGVPKRQALAPRRNGLVVEARRGGGGEDSIDVADRVVASVTYFLPLLDGLRYGRFFFLEVPASRVLLAPIDPIVQFYYASPFASLAVFFGIYYLVVQNQQLSRFVRFNAQQAILVDILLFFASLLDIALRGAANGGIGLQVYISFYNTVFFFIVACFLFGAGSCLAGKTPRLPFVADAADQSVPF